MYIHIYFLLPRKKNPGGSIKKLAHCDGRASGILESVVENSREDFVKRWAKVNSLWGEMTLVRLHLTDDPMTSYDGPCRSSPLLRRDRRRTIRLSSVRINVSFALRRYISLFPTFSLFLLVIFYRHHRYEKWSIFFSAWSLFWFW